MTLAIEQRNPGSTGVMAGDVVLEGCGRDRRSEFAVRSVVIAAADAVFVVGAAIPVVVPVVDVGSVLEQDLSDPFGDPYVPSLLLCSSSGVEERSVVRFGARLAPAFRSTSRATWRLRLQMITRSVSPSVVQRRPTPRVHEWSSSLSNSS